MRTCGFTLGLVVAALGVFHTSQASGQDTEETIFSGPQVGEKLPPLKVQAVFGEQKSEEVSLLDGVEETPLVLFFVHKKTRPAFGLSNALVKYAEQREGLNSAIVYLSDDPVEATQWMNQVKRLFPGGSRYGVSIEGLDGPGAYGLNRNVTMTVLVANEGEVTANFALTQPSMQVDAPKILKAMVEASGGGDVPALEEISPQMRMRSRKQPGGREATDPKLGALVRQVINKDAGEDEVEEAARKVEEYVAKNELARQQLGTIAGRITRSDKLGNYGTAAAQEWIKKWAEKYATPDEPNEAPNVRRGSDQ